MDPDPGGPKHMDPTDPDPDLDPPHWFSQFTKVICFNLMGLRGLLAPTTMHTAYIVCAVRSVHTLYRVFQIF